MNEIQETSLLDRLLDEADLCRNDGAGDVADLLDEAAAEIVRFRRLASLVLEYVEHPLTCKAGRLEILALARTLAGEPQDSPKALLARIEETARETIILENTSADPVRPHFTPKAEPIFCKHGVAMHNFCGQCFSRASSSNAT